MTVAKHMPADSTDWGSDSDNPPAPMTVDDARKAHEVIRPYLAATPLLENPVLTDRLGATAFVKLENSQTMGAFKIRGAINLLASMDDQTRNLGLVTATRGNFGSALAEACAMYGAPCTVFVPEGNSPDKNAAVMALGGQIVVKGHDFDAAWDASVRYAWDQEHAYFPQRTGLVARLRGEILSRLRTWDVASSGRVDLFLANSSFVAGRIRRYYGRQAEVLHPPVDTDFFTPGTDSDSSDDYYLAVAALSPYKQMEEAIGACESLGVELRIVGEGPQRPRLEALAGSHTRLLGRVDDVA